MSFENNANSFRSWLAYNEGLTVESAGSYVSYCRRVERDLKLSLDEWLVTGDRLEVVITRIGVVIPSKKSQGNLQTATRRYCHFLAWQASSFDSQKVSSSHTGP